MSIIINETKNGFSIIDYGWDNGPNGKLQSSIKEAAPSGVRNLCHSDIQILAQEKTKMQKSKCLACGIEKDMKSKEIYPYENDCITTEEPVQPLFEIECQSDTDHTDYRIVTICHNCLHKVQPDMWMSEGEWELLNPITNFNNLPESPDKQDAPRG